MNREKIIETMAKAIFEISDREMDDGTQAVWDASDDWDEHRDWCRVEASNALTALETAIPGLADVIAGRAVVVPAEVTEQMLQAGKRHVEAKYLSSRATAYQSYNAMIEAGKAGE